MCVCGLGPSVCPPDCARYPSVGEPSGHAVGVPAQEEDAGGVQGGDGSGVDEAPIFFRVAGEYGLSGGENGEQGGGWDQELGNFDEEVG